MFKKRWFDGLQDIYEGKDEFEIKFGCFGGDGGNGGGKADPAPAPAPAPTTGFRGEQSANSPSNQGFSGPTGVGIGPGTIGSMSGKSSTADSFGGDNDDPNQTISDAIQASIAAQQTVNNPTNMSINDFTFSQAPTTTNPAEAMQAAITTAPTQASSIATGYQAAQNAISDMVADQVAQDTSAYGNTGMDPSMGTPSSTPGIGFSAFGFNVSPTNISPTSIGFTATKPFAKGGAVHQGIGSVFPYRKR